MRIIWHHNTWPWGKSVKIIASDGLATVDMSFDNNNPGVCFISGLSVVPPKRNQGIAKHLMSVCESYCRDNNIFRIDINSILTDWVLEFYKKCGYLPLEQKDGLMMMYKFLY